jgi:CheY-like chemotaxis protein
MILQRAEIQDELTPSGAPGPLRILVVDDDRAVLGIVNHVVRFLGHIVAGTALNGEECVRRVQELRPDLVMLDLTMPGQDGLETAAAISQKSNVPVIIVTGATDDDTLERLKNAKVAGYLAKPFKLDELKAAIESAMHGER